MDVGSKLTLRVGTGPMPTVRSADAVPLLPSVVVRSPVVDVDEAAVADVTSTEMSQVAPAASVPDATVKVPLAAAAVTVAPQLFVTLGVSAITMPLGKLSVNARSPAGTRAALLSI